MRLLAMGAPAVGAVINIMIDCHDPTTLRFRGQIDKQRPLEHALSLHSHRLPKLRFCQPPNHYLVR